MKNFLIALRTTAVTLLLTGLIYPLAMTGLGQLLFPGAAKGSLVRDSSGHVVGSALIGQSFSKPWYFQGRPSAAGNGYDPLASGGSNLGPSSAKLHERAKVEVARLMQENPQAPGPVPVVSRVAQARGVDPARVKQVLNDHTEGRDLGFLGEPRVNVLLLNLALDRQFGSVDPPLPR
jgi:K+-transporting ATPase ATPase C chain